MPSQVGVVSIVNPAASAEWFGDKARPMLATAKIKYLTMMTDSCGVVVWQKRECLNKAVPIIEL
jgi:hypothetical protein